MYRLGWDQFIPFIVTIVAILATDLLKGIMIGMVFAIFYILRKNFRHAYHYKIDKKGDRDIVTLRLSEEVTFLNKASIQLSLDDLPRNSKVIIDGSNSVSIDHDVLEIINDFKKMAAPQRNIEVETIDVPEVQSTAHH
jgi:carbonic anhydrase